MSKLYNAVAIALAYIYKIDNGEEIEKPEIEIPEDMIFDEFGRKMINRNISQLIVTLAFFYSSLICHFKAIEVFEEKIFCLLISLVLCFYFFCGALRFQIAKLYYKIRDLKKNEPK